MCCQGRSQDCRAPTMIEQQIEQSFIDKLTELKYEYRPDITDRAALEKNFRERFEALNRVKLSESEFARLLDEIVTPERLRRRQDPAQH
jgi:type I restriction enzyme R subunit